MKRGIAIVIAALSLAFASPMAHAALPAWVQAPVVPVIGPKVQKNLRSLITAGNGLGMRAGVFAKVGDSNTDFAPNLYGLACERVALGKKLMETRKRYNRVALPNPQALPDCSPWTSFSRRSVAARGGAYSTWPLVPIEDLPDEGYWRKPPDCELTETPLGCEIRTIRPRYALVMMGSNDLKLDYSSGIKPGSLAFARIGALAKYLMDRGVVPVLLSIPPVVEPEAAVAYEWGVFRTNAAIFRLSRLLRLPFVNFWRALAEPTTVNRGLADDGLHLNLFGADGARIDTVPGPTTFADSVNFTREGLRYGANRRNLIWLKTLAVLDRTTR